MLLFEEARKMVLSLEYRLTGMRIPLSDSPGRFLAEDIFSDIDMPPFDKSAVDGYACCGLIQPADEGSQHSVTLQIIETIPAGSVPGKTVMPGQCSKIMTGGMIPPGADLVVMIENTELLGDNLVKVSCETLANNICYRGEDIRTGDLVLEKGTRLTPAHVAVMAGVGAVNPMVAALPRVGIISTGDELVEPDIIPGTAQIRNTNAWQLEAQVKAIPALPSYYGIAPDDGAELRKIIDLAMSQNDLVLLTGGVSMGDFDFVPGVMEEAGIEILFSSIAIQPGKPTVYGRKNTTSVFGLPGNPVSSLVIFEMLVKPLLFLMMGSTHTPLELVLPLGVDFSRRNTARKSLIPVTITNGAVLPVDYHGSAHINAYTVAVGIMMVEIGTRQITKGELVHVRLL
jgi:molybdopterin molybdotransferase